MSERVYEVWERYVVISTGVVRAHSAAEAIEMAKAGRVEMVHGEPNGKGRMRARLLRDEEARFNDPGPTESSPA